MGKYYYFVAQLPFLQFGKKPAIGSLSFLEEAKKWLSSRDLKILAKVGIDSFITSLEDLEILKAYKTFEQTLREEVALTRKVSSAVVDFKALEVIKPVSLEGNPLDVEKNLLKLRWNFIEAQEGEHFFDLGLLIVYFLKLQILERLFVFDKEKGLAVFDSLCEVKK